MALGRKGEYSVTDTGRLVGLAVAERSRVALFSPKSKHHPTCVSGTGCWEWGRKEDAATGGKRVAGGEEAGELWLILSSVVLNLG